MTSPYSTTLLQQPVEEPAAGEPHTAQVDAPSRSVTRVVAAPSPAPMAQPVYVVPVEARSASNGLTTVILGLIVLLVGAVTLVGAYLAARSFGPSPQEQALTQQVALREGYRAGRDRGIDAGRAQVLEQSSSIGNLQASAARERAYASSYERGMRQGRSSYRPQRSWGGYGYGYDVDWGSGWSGSYEVAAANAYAQELSMATGSTVEVETY